MQVKNEDTHVSLPPLLLYPSGCPRYIPHAIVAMNSHWPPTFNFPAFLLFACLSAPGQTTPPPTQTNVFLAGTQGYHTYRIPAVVLATNGTLLAFCEGRKNSRSDTGDIDLLLKRSLDGGATWTGAQVIWSDGENVSGNPAPVVDRITGTVWLLMTWNLASDSEKAIGAGTARDTRRVYVTSSKDCGVTWGKPQEITAQVKKPGWHWYATGPVNGIQLTRQTHRGRLIIPANHSELSTEGTPVSRSHIIYSDDHGETWHLGGVEDEKTNESAIVELADGSLLHNMRSYHGKNQRAIARSTDGGLTWSAVKLDPALIEPVCQASLLRLTWPGDGSKGRLLFSNPASTKREKLTVRVSYDEGLKWPVSHLLHDGPAAYSCLVALDGQTIGCLFECGEKNPYERIVFQRIPLTWLEKTDLN
jgi:sialidase-1